MSKIAERLQQVQENITAACARAERNPNRVNIVVVTKTAPIEDIKEAIRAGCTDLGENRVQQLGEIADHIDMWLKDSHEENLPPSVNWHMIGHLQRNKVRHALRNSSLIHSLDTLRLAEEINSAAEKMNIKTDVLLQVNCSGELQKYGVPVGAATHLAEQVRSMPHIRLTGLMTMAPLTMNKDVVRSCFVRARELFEEIKGERLAGAKFRHLSMGMSQDYEIAVEEGATMLRIGSAIFS